MPLAHTNCSRLQHTFTPILTELHCRAVRRRRPFQNAVHHHSPQVNTSSYWKRGMRLVCRSLTYSLAVLLCMSAVSSYAAEQYKLTVQVTPGDSTVKFANSK